MREGTMTQRYVDPKTIIVGRRAYKWFCRPSRRLRETIEREGQIVPLLVQEVDGDFFILDILQAERLGAMIEWPTVLVETEWTEEDL